MPETVHLRAEPKNEVRHANGPARRRLAWFVAGAALLLDIAVCIPFLFDPLGWREPTLQASSGAERVEYVLFIDGDPAVGSPALFFAQHPELRVEHTGGWAGTVVISMPNGAAALAERLRSQNFVRLMTRSGTALCRSI